MKKLLLVILLLLSFQVLKAVDIKAVHNGKWNSASTWDLNRIPFCGDNVIIDTPYIVTITSQIDMSACGPMGIFIYGTLKFKAGCKIFLSCGSAIDIFPGGILQPGGGGMSNVITICNIVYWSAGQGTAYGPIHFGSGSPLPVELLSFDAMCNDKVNITWSTATETNNDHFTLARSIDTRNWDFVANIAGASNSNTIHNYQYTDEISYGGISYYRLSQTDFNGKSEVFSPVAVVCTSVETENIIMYPNPFKGELKIHYTNLNEGKAQLKVYNMMGKIILIRIIEVTQSSNYLILDLSNIAEGLYNVEFTFGNIVSHQKVLKK
jgi:hypothetical protein